MRHGQFRLGLVVLLLLGVPPVAWAQEGVPLTIRSVTSETLPTGEVVLVIAGVGFGAAPAVTVDGRPVEVLPEVSDTRITVLAPPAILTMPGTYRLTVQDPATQQWNVFVVASPPGTAAAAGSSVAGAGGVTGTAAVLGAAVGMVAVSAW